MLRSLALLLVLFVALNAGTHQHHGSPENAHLMLDATQDQDVTQDHLNAPDQDLIEILSRGRRATRGRHCGRKVATLVLTVCGQVCEPTTAFNIATHCCAQECDADHIRSICCPDSMLR